MNLVETSMGHTESIEVSEILVRLIYRSAPLKKTISQEIPLVKKKEGKTQDH